MSSTQSKTINITLDNKGTYLSGSGTIDMSYTTNLGMTAGSSKTGYVTVTPQGMSELFQNNVAQPLRLTVSYYHYALTSNADNYSCLTIDANQVIKTASSDYSAVTYDNSGAIATSLTKNSSIQWTLHTKKKSVFESNPWTALGGYEGIQITTYFTRYDFSATAGSNVSSASVSSSTGYDGDQITYSCVLASGATFDGWYDGSTRVSTNQSYTMTVSGADVALEARATASVEPSKSFSAIYGNSIVISQNQNSSVSVGYNSGTITSLTDSDRIKHLLCKDKYMATAVTAGGKTLNCGGKISGYNIPMLYCYGSWELNKGLVVGTATLADASGWVTTPFIPVSGKINVTVETGGTRDGASMLNEYDNGFNYASYWGHGSNPRTFTLDTAASYIRCTFLMSGLSNCYIKDNTNGKYLFKGGNVT